MKKISIVPTWAAATRIYVMALENGTGAGQNAARDELLRLGRQYDEAIDIMNDLLSALEDAVEALKEARYYPSELQRFQAAISKARGES